MTSPIALLLYGLFVLAAIGGIGWLLKRLGHAEAALPTRDAAAALVKEATGAPPQGPPFETENAVLFRTREGACIVRSHGSHTHLRNLVPGDLRRADAQDHKLRLRLRSFEEPVVTLRTEDPEALSRWLAEAGVVPGPLPEALSGGAARR
ncbi:hypothetical protein [Parvularcula dongshanensis]|uniref:DUF2550 family protein n=1 Tax=Parvularcula dongshanensis TaxID=1173995 RepID=A0A840I5S3_9PROT|nr:hypothetical protein [Parvularcula dongshanensis]MBB4659665.1 hypothetical protein [Parvularcula dongshanensis]